MNTRCFVNRVAVRARGRTDLKQDRVDCHVSPSPQPNAEAVGEARAVHALIKIYLLAGLPRAVAVEAAWRECAHCFSNLFPNLAR